VSQTIAMQLPSSIHCTPRSVLALIRMDSPSPSSLLFLAPDKSIPCFFRYTCFLLAAFFTHAIRSPDPFSGPEVLTACDQGWTSSSAFPGLFANRPTALPALRTFSPRVKCFFPPLVPGCQEGRFCPCQKRVFLASGGAVALPAQCLPSAAISPFCTPFPAPTNLVRSSFFYRPGLSLSRPSSLDFIRSIASRSESGTLFHSFAANRARSRLLPGQFPFLTSRRQSSISFSSSPIL